MRELKKATGRSSSTSSVLSSTALTPSSSIPFSPATIASAFFKPATPIMKLYSLAVSGLTRRFHANSKSLAVTGVPFDHLASRMVKVYFMPSSLRSTFSAIAS
ncbi:hypothetical protein D3C78_1127760 [compost metagenome]